MILATVPVRWQVVLTKGGDAVLESREGESQLTQQ